MINVILHPWPLRKDDTQIREAFQIFVFKYRVLIVIYFSHLFLYIKFSLRVLNNLLLYIYKNIYIYCYFISYLLFTYM